MPLTHADIHYKRSAFGNERQADYRDIYRPVEPVIAPLNHYWRGDSHIIALVGQFTERVSGDDIGNLPDHFIYQLFPFLFIFIPEPRFLQQFIGEMARKPYNHQSKMIAQNTDYTRDFPAMIFESILLVELPRLSSQLEHLVEYLNG